jgi:hypothetical protein
MGNRLIDGRYRGGTGRGSKGYSPDLRPRFRKDEMDEHAHERDCWQDAEPGPAANCKPDRRCKVTGELPAFGVRQHCQCAYSYNRCCYCAGRDC